MWLLKRLDKKIGEWMRPSIEKKARLEAQRKAIDKKLSAPARSMGIPPTEAYVQPESDKTAYPIVIDHRLNSLHSVFGKIELSETNERSRFILEEIKRGQRYCIEPWTALA